MARRPDPERIYQSQRAATLERLVSAGLERQRADAGLTAYVEEHGRPAGVLGWDAAFRQLASAPGSRR